LYLFSSSVQFHTGQLFPVSNSFIDVDLFLVFVYDEEGGSTTGVHTWIVHICIAMQNMDLDSMYV
jgi:hypothetical protein